MRARLASLLMLMTTSVMAGQPNILVIMCDDLGYSDVGFNGATDIVTPELDRLAKNGAILTSAYVAHPFCGPSRMGLMTGRYPHEFGAPFNLPETGDGNEEYYQQGVDVNETLISKVLQNAGYYTGAIGKWHMGTAPQFHPNRRGFDYYYGFLGGGHKYFPEQYRPIYEQQVQAGAERIWDYVLPLERNGAEVDANEYITDALSHDAVRFLKEASTRDQPFFLYLAYNAPHTPLEAKEEDMQRFSSIQDKKRRTYAGMVYAVDRGVGEIVEALKSSGSFDDTLIVFLSDNGGKLIAGATNEPLKEGKGSVYEGGYRVPMFFHWPRRVAAGTRYQHTVSALDFYPTFASLGGGEIPQGKHLDGKDIWDDFLAGRNPRKGEMIFALRHQLGFSDVGARQDQWKICKAYRQPWKIFNLEQDISEEHDLSAQYPEQLREMVSKAELWSRGHTEPRWFHDLATRDNWKQEGMPHYEETFKVD